MSALGRPLRVLFISNFSSERCGVRIFGEIWVEALRMVGVEIWVWDGTYPAVARRGYTPWTSGQGTRYDWDLVHLNWDPQTINHYLPEHFAPGVAPPLSLFLHDVPPNSSCPVLPVARLVMSYEEMEGSHVIEHAVPAWGGHRIHDCTRWSFLPATVPVIGVSGIRGDPGANLVEELCLRRGWVFNCPPWWYREMGAASTLAGPFLSTEEEIHRLSHSDVNICWYHTSGRGKSMAAMFCVAAGRPLVLSGSTMFSNLVGYGDEVYCLSTHNDDNTVNSLYAEAEGLEQMVDLALETRIVPTRAAKELSWEVRALEIKALWEGMI